MTPRMAMEPKATEKRLRDTAAMSPGDEAPPGTPGTGEAMCPDCKGSGRIAGAPCETCSGTGRVVEGIGGA